MWKASLLYPVGRSFRLSQKDFQWLYSYYCLPDYLSFRIVNENTRSKLQNLTAGVEKVWEQENSKPRFAKCLTAQRVCHRILQVRCTLCWAGLTCCKTRWLKTNTATNPSRTRARICYSDKQ